MKRPISQRGGYSRAQMEDQLRSDWGDAFGETQRKEFEADLRACGLTLQDVERGKCAYQFVEEAPNGASGDAGLFVIVMAGIAVMLAPKLQALFDRRFAKRFD